MFGDWWKCGEKFCRWRNEHKCSRGSSHNHFEEVLQVHQRIKQRQPISPFSSPSGINWDRLNQSVHSITQGVGRHFVIVEGYMLFECDTLLDNADYIVILTALPSTLHCRPEPTPEQSLQLYISQVQPHLQALNDSKGIMKINGISTPDTVIKKIGTFIALKNKGFQNCGKRLSDTRSLLEVSTTTE